MPELTQDNRLAQITTPLGNDVLVLRSLHAEEQLGQLFRFDLELLSENPKISPTDLIGKEITIHLDCGEKRERFFHGLVNRFTQTTRYERYYRYQATVVPSLWLLTRTADCRIFQNKTIPDIIEQVCRDSGVEVAEKRLSATYTPWEYCVQYRETDFHFLSRLMEQEGIYYFFEHVKGAHHLILADHPGAHSPISGYEKVPFRQHTKNHHVEDQFVQDWAVETRFNPNSFVHTDYDFTKPRVDLKTNSAGKDEAAQAVGEVFDYPGEYIEFSDGGDWAKVRMQSIETGDTIARGFSDAMGLAAGAKFTLTETPPEITGGDFLIISTAINCQVNVFETGSAASGGNVFNCGLNAMDAEKYFRPSRTTLKPLIRGVQTAVVTGPKGEEIYTDKYGRVKVQFFWDREGKKDENTTCFIRVGQSWAGKRWGATFIPRIGQEVIVAFLEGDPDQPIIVGSVYNGDQMFPYLGDGPDAKHKHDPNLSGIKSLSTKGGAGYNEWRFDDTKGKEEIFIHGERNSDTRIKNDAMENIGHDRFLTVGGEKDGKKEGNQFEMVFKDKHLKVHHDHEEQIGNDQKLHVGGIDGGTGNQDIILDGTRKELIKKDDNLHVQGERKQKIDKDTSLTVGGNQQEKVGKNHALEAGQEIHLKAGMKCIIEAGMQLTIKVGGNFVDIGPAGVTIVGTMVKINSGGAAGSGSGSSPASPDDAAAANPTLPTVADESQPGSMSSSSASPASVVSPPSVPKAPAVPSVPSVPGMPSVPIPSIPAIPSLSSITPGFFNCVSNAAQKAGQAIDQGKKTVSDAKAAVKKVTTQVQAIETEVKGIVQDGEAVVKQTIQDAKDEVKQVIQEGQAVVNQAVQEGQAVVNQAKDEIKNAETAVDDLKGAVQQAGYAVDDLKQAASQRSTSGVKSAIQAGKDAVNKAQDAYKTAKDGVQKAENAYNDAKNKAEQTYNDAKNKIEGVYGDVKQKAEKAYNNAKNVINKAENTVKEAVDDVKGDIDTAKNLVEDVKSTVKAAGDALNAAEQCV